MMNQLSAPPRVPASTLEAVAIDDLPLPYFEMDATGVITRANRAALALLPQEEGSLVGSVAFSLMATGEKEQASAAYRAIMESGEAPGNVLRSLYTRHGEFRTYELHRILMRDGDGRSVGIRLICVDITQSTRELDEARRARQWLESVLHSAPDAVIVTDALGFIRAANPAAESLLGWREGELTGKLIEKAMPLLKYVSPDGRTLSFNLSLEGASRGIATILDRGRQALEVEISTSPILDKQSGFTNGVLSVIRRV